MIIVTQQQEKPIAVNPTWQGSSNHQTAVVGGIRLEVHKRTDDTHFIVKVNGITVAEDAVDLMYARRQALYELEAAIANLQSDVSLLWSATP